MLLLLALACHPADTVKGIGINDLRVSLVRDAAQRGGGSTADVTFSWPPQDNHCSTVENVTVTLGGVAMNGDQAALGGVETKGGCITSARYTLAASAAPSQHGVQQLVIKDRSGELDFALQTPYKPRHLYPTATLPALQKGSTVTFTTDLGDPLVNATAFFDSADGSTTLTGTIAIRGASFDVTVPDNYTPGTFRMHATATVNALPVCDIETCDAEVMTNTFVHDVELQ